MTVIRSIGTSKREPMYWRALSLLEMRCERERSILPYTNALSRFGRMTVQRIEGKTATLVLRGSAR
jgi:hypothetical protein